MFRLDVLQNQWLILALVGGVVLTLALICAYTMMWRPRNETGEPVTGAKALIRWIPWFLIALFICIVIYQVTYTIILHFYPPNI